MIPTGIEPGTLSVLDSCDNHYTMESHTPHLSKEHNIIYLGTGSAFLDTVLGGGGGAGWEGAGYAFGCGAWYAGLGTCPFLSAGALLPLPLVREKGGGTGEARGERGSRW